MTKVIILGADGNSAEANTVAPTLATVLLAGLSDEAFTAVAAAINAALSAVEASYTSGGGPVALAVSVVNVEGECDVGDALDHLSSVYQKHV